MLSRLDDEGAIAKSFPAKVARGSAVDDHVMALISGTPVGKSFEQSYLAYCAEYLVPFPDVAKEVAAGLAQVDLFEREVLPTLPEVYQTQMEVHWDLDGIPYHAHLDITFADGSVADLKAPDQRLGARRVDEDYQLTTYAAALYGAFGQVPPRVELIGLVNSKMPEDVAVLSDIAPKDRPKPWLDRQVGVRTLQQIVGWQNEAYKREASRRWASTTGIYLTNGRTGLYTCSGCPAKPQCPAWAGFEMDIEAKVRDAA
jgi:hypothetical protein